MPLTKLNAWGEVPNAPTPRPASAIGQNTQRQVGVLYGHNGSGKVYNYLGGSGLRAGDIVTPEVTHPKSGKTYRTLARVVTTRDSLNVPSQGTAAHLSGQGILMKSIGRTDQKSLPGFQTRQAQDPNFTAKQWEQEAQTQYSDGVMRRLNPMGEAVK